MAYSNWLTDSITTDGVLIVPELTNPTEAPEPDGATLTIESDSDLGTLYSYSKTTPFGADEAANAAEIIANGVGQAPVIGTNTRVVTGQDGMTDHYAGWVQDSEGYGSDLAMEFNIATDGETLTIPGNIDTYLFDIDWGDGTVETGLTTEGAGPHTYTLAGDYVVRISGEFPRIYFTAGGDVAKLVRVLNYGDVGATQYLAAFKGAVNLVEASSGVSDFSAVTTMREMYSTCTAMVDPPDFKHVDTSNVTNMRELCRAMSAMTSPPDFSSFNTSKVTLMNFMCHQWYVCTSPPDFSSFDMGSATSISSMCSYWTSMGAVDIAIDQWQIQTVTDFSNFMVGSQLTTACYDRTLASWGNQTLAAGAASATIHFGTSQYTDAASHALLLAQVTNIIDGGLAP